MRTLLLACAFGAFAAGCAKPTYYAVHPLTYETIAGKLDGEWFEREISGQGGTRAAIELVYCPIVASGPTVCRTAVIWEKDKTALMGSK